LMHPSANRPMEQVSNAMQPIDKDKL